jgi:hypothetical protein
MVPSARAEGPFPVDYRGFRRGSTIGATCSLARALAKAPNHPLRSDALSADEAEAPAEVTTAVRARADLSRGYGDRPPSVGLARPIS